MIHVSATKGLNYARASTRWAGKIKMVDATLEAMDDPPCEDVCGPSF